MSQLLIDKFKNKRIFFAEQRTLVKYLRRLILLGGSVTFLLTISYAQDAEEFNLANGLKIIVQPDYRAPVVVSQIWYRVGSAYEYDGITGISHALEHMMFKGTKSTKPGEFSEIVSQRGGTENAFTSTDFTAYYQQWSPENLELSFKLEADRMNNLVFDEQEFLQERAVVLEERSLRVDDNPTAQAYETLKANAFLTSPYRYPVIGWRADISELTVADLRRWYERFYHPNNSIIVVVGDVSAPEVFRLAKKYFGDIPKGPEIKVKSRREIPQNGNKRIVLTSEEARVEHLVLGYKTPSLKQAVIDDDVEEWEPFALEVLATVLDGFEGARLESSVVRKLKLATSTSVSYSWATLLPDLFTVSAIPEKNVSLDKLEGALKKEIAKLVSKPPVDTELRKVIAQTVAESVFQTDSIAYQAILIGSLEAVGLDWRLKEQYIDRVKSVTSEQVANVAEKYLMGDSVTVVHLVPGGAK